jgi:PAS domain S-box-containing protein
LQEPLHIVHLEDDLDDVLLVSTALREDGLECEIVHVSTRDAFVAALDRGNVDLILSDYALPSFDGLSALAIAREAAPHAPFILLSGTLGEEAAIESLRNGATDYVLKTRLSRLVPAVQRALEESRERTTRQRAEQSLLREQSFLRAVLDQMRSGLAICDPDGVLMLFNRSMRDLLGLAEDPALPGPWPEHVDIVERDGKTSLTPDAMPLARALRGEHLHHVELSVLHRAGGVRMVEASGQPIIDQQGRRLGAVITMQDVTEHKQLEHQLQHAQKMEAIGRLAAGVAHDFNNLLTVISGYCEMAGGRAQPGDAITQDLQEITSAVERAGNLTRQLLAFSRQQVLEPRLIDMNDVIGEMEKMLHRLIGTDVEMMFKPSDSLGRVRADAGQIGQVLVNLVINARDAMPQGGWITIETANVVVGDLGSVAGHQPGRKTDVVRRTRPLAASPDIPPGRYVSLTVTDSGTGMDTHTAARIFEPFFTTKEAGRGTGLGLSTVHGIVKQSGGHIIVDTEPGCGTGFRIFLPQAEPSEVAPAPGPRPAHEGDETILVVDDDAVLLRMVGEILQKRGYTVLPVNSGRAALALLEDPDTKVDAMVTDVVMPGLSGREVVDRLRASGRQLPTVFMSGYVGENIETLRSRLGDRVTFIQKPFTLEALLEKIRSVLDGGERKAA